MDAIQTDAAINPGNSGGALVDCDGRLVGVLTAGATVPNASGEASPGSVGIGFAIPIDLADLIAKEIIETGSASHSYLGLQTAGAQGADVSPSGLRVVDVDPNGPTANAGIRCGDVITIVEGESLRSSDQLIALTLTKRAGAEVELEIERSGAARADRDARLRRRAGSRGRLVSGDSVAGSVELPLQPFDHRVYLPATPAASRHRDPLEPRNVPNGEIVFPIEAALNFAPEGRTGAA